MWTTVGIVICLAVAVAGWLRSRTAGGHYDADTYGMTPATHLRYAWYGIALAALLGISFFVPALPSIVLLGIAVLVGIFYLTSFLRGAQADE